jgi:protochlorophyllide reductase
LALLGSGEYHVVGAVRDLDKMETVAEIDGFDLDNFTPMECELNSFESVRQFCKNVDEFRMTKPIDRLICNAGVYQPSLEYAKWSKDNCEQTMQINFLSHFLMISQLMDGMIDSPDPRVIMVGSVTGNDNTVGGGGVYPIADLHDLEGFEAGFENPIAMADGYGFIGAKAYKDSKLCLMMLANFLHTKYHKLTGITFTSMYPGCIAESPLFREKRPWFRKYFPVFMKFITGTCILCIWLYSIILICPTTIVVVMMLWNLRDCLLTLGFDWFIHSFITISSGGFVGEHEAGQRLFQVAHDPRCTKSGVYWSWNGGPREGRGAEAIEKGGQISGGGGAGGGWDSIFENDQSYKVLNVDTQMKLFEYATQITKAEWPDLRQITSPCPTLMVIGAVTQGMVKREELKRMREMDRPGLDGSVASTEPVKISKSKKVAMVADRVVAGTLGNTVGRVARFAGKRMLGEMPDEAKTGSFHEEKEKSSQSQPADMEGKELIESAISDQLKIDKVQAAQVDVEDEALFRELYDGENTKAEESDAIKV